MVVLHDGCYESGVLGETQSAQAGGGGALARVEASPPIVAGRR
jgi:hypothetical protein